MEIMLSHIIGFRNSTVKQISPGLPEASSQEINDSLELAQDAFAHYRKITTVQRSVFLEAIATNIEILGDTLLEKIHEETALPLTRLAGERGRTTGQLRLFAQLLKEGNWNREIVDEALPERKPAPRPELIQTQVPLGVVAVFGASNFPLAFSVAGGDTASALAAGCPVVFKAHPAHPVTCQLVGQAIQKAARETGMPEGIFSMIHGSSHDTGGILVTHPLVKAVAFTGSFRGGKALYDLAVRRKEPIPVYAEMGSVNPVFFLPFALKENGRQLAGAFAQSITQGSGQFCTNPGVCVLMNNDESKNFIRQVAESISSIPLHSLLTPGILAAYQSGIEKQQTLPGASVITKSSGPGVHSSFISVSARRVLQHPDYLEEVFGPSTVAVLTDSFDEMIQVIDRMPGQLTGTIHAVEQDYDSAIPLIDHLSQKVGRLLMNGFPTGVEVSHAMVHGGPYPATTDSRSTSVGTTSIYRFTRPICFQNIPDSLKSFIKMP